MRNFVIICLGVVVLWAAATLVTAIARGQGHGFVFVGALVLIGLVLMGAVWALLRLVWKR